MPDAKKTQTFGELFLSANSLRLFLMFFNLVLQKIFLKIPFLILVGVLIHPQLSYSMIELGAGYSSSFSGRQIPALNIAYSWNQHSLSGFSTGVKTSLYFQNAYGLSYYRPWTTHSFWWGPLKTSFGLGLTYLEYAFQDFGSTLEEKKQDYNFGPAFKAIWLFTSWSYLSLEAMWGLRSFEHHLLLHFQDHVRLGLGVYF